MDLIVFYMIFFLFCGAVAWYFSGFRFVQRLDDRLFGVRRPSQTSPRDLQSDL